MIRPTSTPSEPPKGGAASGALPSGAARYPFAVACVAAATGAVAAVDVMLALTPLALFALAVAASAARGGVKPGLVAAALAALVSNYLFVAPRYELSFDGEVARLIVLYLAAVPVARFVATRVRLRRARRQNAAPSPAPADDAALLPAGLGAMAPLLAAACGVVALAVPMLAGAAGHPAPVPAVVVAAAFFLVLVSTRRPRGR